jgi:hypothetical protein
MLEQRVLQTKPAHSLLSLVVHTRTQGSGHTKTAAGGAQLRTLSHSAAHAHAAAAERGRKEREEGEQKTNASAQQQPAGVIRRRPGADRSRGGRGAARHVASAARPGSRTAGEKMAEAWSFGECAALGADDTGKL